MYQCIYPSLFPVTLWELEVAQGVPKSERESWLLESVETLLTCGDPINLWRDLVTMLRLKLWMFWCGREGERKIERGRDPNKAWKPH